MEDYSLLTFKQIRKLVVRQVREERHKIDPNHYNPEICSKLVYKYKPENTKERALQVLQKSNMDCAFAAKDLFYSFKKELNFTDPQLDILTSGLDVEGEEILGKVFTDFMLFLVKDVILNNSTIKIPCVGAYCEFHMEELSDEEFKAKRQKGLEQDINIIMSNFKSYHLVFVRYDKQDSTKWWKTNVIIDSNLRKELVSQVNSGKAYYDTTPKSINEYIEQFQYLYPNISYKLLDSIIKFGCRQVTLNNKGRKDILLKNPTHFMYIGNIEAFCGTKPQVYYTRQMRKKLERLFTTKHIKWDGYYYFCLSRDEYNYYFRPTMGHKRKMLMNHCRANGTKYFFFKYDKLLFKHPEIALCYYINSKYLVRAKASQDWGLHRYIRPYIPIPHVEVYEHVGKNTMESLTHRKYKILCQKKQQ